VSLDAYLGAWRFARSRSLGQAITVAGEFNIDCIVAVRHPPPEEKDRPITWCRPAARAVS